MIANSNQSPPETSEISPEEGSRAICWMILGALLFLCVILLLPVDPYYRFQQTDGTILFRARNIYERIHFDRAPIDVAMIGSSRMEASVRAPEVTRLLSTKLGRPTQVVNFGLPQEGRDLHWVIVQELLRNRPETQLIVLSLGQESQLSHPGFRFLADAASIVTAPILYNKSYLLNVLTIPYQHIVNSAQAIWPYAFALSRTFDRKIYEERSFDPTESFKVGPAYVDRDQEMSASELEAQRAAIAQTLGTDRLANFFPLDQRFAIERYFLRRIANFARDKHVKVAFLRVPTYGQEETFADFNFYQEIGPVLDAKQFGADADDYMDIGHLGRRGTAKLAPWLTDRLATLLEPSGQR